MSIEWYFKFYIQRQTVLGISYCLTALAFGSLFGWVVFNYVIGNI